ncbi:PadR family transcriptional regulator [Roseivirga sp.]|uniref:PadR family transcriptional regulator n=1 Tax=Roseivirga sp. TaxID=1964215 RepID=UPI003B524119
MKGKGNYIGELEELVLLLVGILRDDAYAVSVLKEMKDQTGRELNISAIHAVLNRLEEKGWLTSDMGGATDERGGRRKRFYQLTASGKSMLDEVKLQRDQLYNQLPVGFTYSFNS